MTTTPAKAAEQPSAATLESVLIRGDLSQLTEAQRNEYYLRVCQSLGLNPLTQPFDYLILSGKLRLYAKRDAADQLRKINGISVEIVGREVADGLLIVHARATDKGGRSDEDFGVVAFKGGGTEFTANAMMKAVTKAKRRVTLSISGLGFLDETETASATRTQRISKDQVRELRALADTVDADMSSYLDYLSERWEMQIDTTDDIPASRYEDAVAQLERKRNALAKGSTDDAASNASA